MRAIFFIRQGLRCAAAFLYLIADNVIPVLYSRLSP